MTKIVNLITKEQNEQEKYKNDLLEIIDNFREMVSKGEVVEFAISSRVITVTFAGTSFKFSSNLVPVTTTVVGLD